MEEYLWSIYYDPANPASFGSLESLYRKAIEDKKPISRQNIKKWLQSQDAYTLHKKANKKFNFRRVIVHAIDQQWQTDIVDLKAYATTNKNFKYILTTIDVFSKYGWAVGVKTNTGPEIADVFKNIFKTRKPEKLQSDEGLEFKNKFFYELMKENKVSY